MRTMSKTKRTELMSGAGMILAGMMILTSMGCPVLRTEHKIETTHRIEAHIIIDINQIRQEAVAVENEVRGGAEVPKARADGKPVSMAVDVPGAPGSPDTMNTMNAMDIEGWQSAERRPRSIWSIFDISTAAYAGAADGEEAGAEKAAITGRKSRHDDVEKALSAGCLGENNKGYVEVRPCDGTKDEKAGAKKLAGAENADRKTVYAAVAIRQGLEAEQAGLIGPIFAGEIRKKLTAGQAFQMPADDKVFDEFVKTDAGKTHAKAGKGDWVTAK